jgi:hypothetical protein
VHIETFRRAGPVNVDDLKAGAKVIFAYKPGEVTSKSYPPIYDIQLEGQ